MKKFSFLKLALLILFLTPTFVLADDVGDTRTFYVDSSYDVEQREEVEAVLATSSSKAYFYLGQDWYSQLNEEKKEEVDTKLNSLGKEFDNNIYPTLTSTYGEIWEPGIDNDYHVTILFYEMEEDSAGYFRSNDEYEQVQVPGSNEREMIYVNAKYLTKDIAKSYVAHEFTHLITFNQKNRLRGTQEAIWLNESRADYAPTIVNYDSDYSGSNLQQRIRQFINSQNDSLLEWKHRQQDYGVINAFTHYLVDHYGQEILVNSLRSSKKGIDSINYALEENGFDTEFKNIFTDWTVAIFLNDCEVEEKYCYKNEHFKKINANSNLIFLPNTQQTDIAVNYSIKPWSGHWYRIMGGEGDLTLRVDGHNSVDFEIPYVMCENGGSCTVNSLKLNQNQQGSTTLENFGNKYSSLTLIPSVQSITSGGENLPSYDLSVEASMDIETEREQENQRLRQRIAELQAKIDELLERLNELRGNDYACSKINQDLVVGMRGEQVKCLQQFLKAQGDDIYPEGLVTGYFGPLTKAAVIRFQERYQSEILAPWSLHNGTGYVGRTTKQKINKMIN
ncbi:hypothetical protein AKJ56_01810 [candidate division MSBL1 archaeon SCGC-AAA382N08]|uniref:Peptidoglycan binding-like domain-containing protein n=1 Tax=candidate division MSBL1 archaeon SCGC-AAA382N08 TaxID=1698285 RepID=A0A133VNW0_9EURY|nr:hypothetical protein AKJ56_01810 [candidate division MSBL1 archaeon SCGC-AAA382N08]